MSTDPPHDPGGSVLVLSAHPDDEVLAVGAWIATQAHRDFLFVTSTDGEASHPGNPDISPEELAARRPDELVEALRELGVSEPRIRRLRLPDGELATHREELREMLRPLVARADLVLAPFEDDGHPDHDTLGAVALDLCRGGPVLWRFPIWTWAWTVPEDQTWLSDARRLECLSVARARKRRAVAAFATQVRPVGSDVEPVVSRVLLDHALLAAEVVLV